MSDFRNVGLEKNAARESLIGPFLSGLTMQPLVLTLKGFRGIRDGLGRDELKLDFEQFAGDAELVAIAGSNGRGKSTILDNMSPLCRSQRVNTGTLSPCVWSVPEERHAMRSLPGLAPIRPSMPLTRGGQYHSRIVVP